MSASGSSRSRTEKRARILAAAGTLFDRYGPVKTTIADIAREAEMSAANIYNFFKSREEVIEAVGDLHLADLKHTIARGLSSKASAWDAICYLFLENACRTRAHLKSEKDLLRLQLLAKQEGWQFVIRYHEFIRAQLEAQLRAGLTSGEFGDVDPVETASILFDCMVAAIDPMLILKTDQARHERQLRAQLDLLRKALR